MMGDVDHMLGLLEHPNKAFPRIAPGDERLSNALKDGTTAPVWQGDADYYVSTGPGHKHNDVMHQMYGVQQPPNADGLPSMKGFAANHYLRDDKWYRDAMP